MAYDKNKPANDSYLAEFPPEQREQQRAIIEDQIVDAGRVRGLIPGNAIGNIPVSNGDVNTNLNAEMLEGNHASSFASAGHTHSVATSSSNGMMSNTDKIKLNGINVGAEANQNAFSNILIGDTTIQADSKTDTLELVGGSNISVTPDVTNDRVTIALEGTIPKATTADKLTTARTVSFTGDATGSVSFDGSANKTVALTVPNVTTSGGSADKLVKTNSDGYLDRTLKQKYLIPSSVTSYVGQWVKLGDLNIYGSGSSYTATLNVIDGAWNSYGVLRVYIRIGGSPIITNAAELTWLSASGKLETLYGNFKLVYSTADPTQYSLWFNPTVTYERYYFTVGEEGGNGNFKMTYYSDRPYQATKPTGTVVSAVRDKQVVVISGTAKHDEIIPLPAGFTDDQCRIIVSPEDYGTPAFDVYEGGVSAGFTFRCDLTANRQVVAKHGFNAQEPQPCWVNFIVIGVK